MVIPKNKFQTFVGQVKPTKERTFKFISMETIVKQFNTIYPLSDNLKSRLRKRLKEKYIYRQQYLLHSGHVCLNMYFIKYGLLRGFNDKGTREFSSRFMKEGDLCIAPQSYFTQSPSSEAIVSMEDSLVYYLPYQEVEDMRYRFPEFNFILFILLIKDYLAIDQCLSTIRTHAVAERYAWLIDNQQWLLKSIPAKHLATYLGMADATLSRIKAR